MPSVKKLVPRGSRVSRPKFVPSFKNFNTPTKNLDHELIERSAKYYNHTQRYKIPELQKRSPLSKNEVTRILSRINPNNRGKSDYSEFNQMFRSIKGRSPRIKPRASIRRAIPPNENLNRAIALSLGPHPNVNANEQFAKNLEKTYRDEELQKNLIKKMSNANQNNANRKTMKRFENNYERAQKTQRQIESNHELARKLQSRTAVPFEL